MRLNVLTYTAIFFISVLLGGLTITTLSMWRGYTEYSWSLSRMQSAFSTAAILRYGTVESVDIPGRSLAVRVSRPGGKSALAVIFIDDSTFIAKQYLIGTNGVYATLSTPERATFEDIRVGDRVAMINRNTESGILTTYLLFGDPL